MSGFTKGPWSVGVSGNGAVGSVYCDDATGSRVAIVYGKGQEFSLIPREVEKANARLIASSPELYEALKQAVTSMQDSGYSNSHIAIRAARAALSKAAGEGV